jgi:hypothetical protein
MSQVEVPGLIENTFQRTNTAIVATPSKIHAGIAIQTFVSRGWR